MIPVQNSLIPIPIPIPATPEKSDSDSRQHPKSLIPIPIPGQSGIIPESIPIPESESCITGVNMYAQPSGHTKIFVS